jgi:hypothetical protein
VLASIFGESDSFRKLRLINELEERIRQFVYYYNHECYHESLNNLTLADVFYGRGQSVLDKREKIKLQTLVTRRQMYYRNLSTNSNLVS